MTERVLVCVSASPLAPRVVRAAHRMAAGAGAEWVVAYVETPAQAGLPEPDRIRAADTLALGEGLGARSVTLTGPSVADELLAYARAAKVSKLVVGKPAEPRWRELLFGSVVNELIRKSGDIDVYVITGEREAPRPAAARVGGRRRDWLPYARATGVVALSTAVAWLAAPYFELSNLIMVYLLGVVLAAVRFGRGPSIVASVLSVAAFDFFFVPPRLTFAVADTQYLVTFAVMLVVAVVISTLTARVGEQAESARQRERRTTALYAMSRELAGTRDVDELLGAAVRHIAAVFASAVTVFLPDPEGRLEPRSRSGPVPEDEATERDASEWVFAHQRMAGPGTGTLAGARALYLPLVAARGAIGVLGVYPPRPDTFEPPEQRHLLETFAAQAALAIERALLAEEARQAEVRAESERLRNTLLSSVSHDLRTPLATITGAASSLLEGTDRLDPAARGELLHAIHEEADRLNRLVHNLLDMTRLQSGAIQVRTEWHPLEEIVGAALARLSGRLGDRPVTTRLPADLPLVPVDGLLMEQVLINLLDNAIKHTPPGTPIEIAASIGDDRAWLEVADRGPGLLPGDEARVFDKFFRGRPAGPDRGVGLGLAICRGIVEAHGSRIAATNRPGGGVAFRVALPLAGKPPEIPPDDG